jgi:hypothetical protein
VERVGKLMIGLFSLHFISLALGSERTKPHLSFEMGFCYCIPLGPPSRVQKKPRVKLTTGQARGLQNLFLNPNSLSLSSLIQDKNRTP